MRARTVQAMASFAGGKIGAYVGPPELGAADDLEQVIVDFIRGAKSSLDIAVQEIDSRAIAQAILDARWRGIRVNYRSSRVPELPPAQSQCLQDPRQALERRIALAPLDATDAIRRR